MFNKTIALIIGLLCNNMINAIAIPGIIKVGGDPRNANYHPTPKQWYLSSFKKIKYEDEKEAIINFLCTIIKKFESARKIVNEQINLIEQGSDMQNAFQTISDATLFNIPLQPEFVHLTPILMELLKTIMPFTHKDFPNASTDPDDKEKAVTFLKKYAIGFVNTILEKSNECLFYIEKEL